MIVFIDGSNAQKQNNSPRNFGPGFCDSIQEISKEYLDSHQRKLSIIDTANIPPKKGNRVYVKFGKDSLVFKDKSYEADSGFMLYNAIIGIDKKWDWVLIESSDEVANKYFLIDQKNVCIDTLVGYPYILGDKLVTVRDICNDCGPTPIETWKIEKNGKLTLLFEDYFQDCSQGIIDSKRYFISIQNEFMYKTIWDDKYWLIKGALF